MPWTVLLPLHLAWNALSTRCWGSHRLIKVLPIFFQGQIQTPTLSLMQVVSLPLEGPSASCSPVCQVLRGSMANAHGIEGKLQTCSLSSFLFCDSRGRGASEVRGHSGTWRWQMSPEPHPPSHGVTSPLQEILQVFPGGRVLLRGFAGW